MSALPLYRQMPAVRGPVLRARSMAPGQSMPAILAGGWELSREEAAAALFETCTDQLDFPSVSTHLLAALLRESVDQLGAVELMKLTEDFGTLDGAEFPEVDDCRWYAYRLALTSWYLNAAARPMTYGEAAAALALSEYGRHASISAHTNSPRMLAVHIRHGAARVPADALVRLGRTLTAEVSRLPATRPGSTWLYRQVLPDHNRNRRCLDLIRAGRPIPLPLVVRDRAGALTLGTVPPPGPGNRWTRSATAEW